MFEYIKKNLFQIIALILATAGAWYGIYNRIDLLEERIRIVNEDVHEIQSKEQEYVTKREIDEVKSSLKEINGKLDKVIEREITK